MKKLQYIQPAVEFTETALVQILAASSGSITGSIEGAEGDGPSGFGGSDTEGILDPATKDDKYDWDW